MPPDPYTYAYPRPMVTVDAVVLASGTAAPQVLLIRRKNAPFAGFWALPGGFVDMEESLETAAARELEEETGLRGVSLSQLHTFGDVGRDPRGRNITVVYCGQLAEPSPVRAGDDAAEAAWFPARALPPMAFDHDRIVAMALGIT